jgi:hypothetical protein
MKIFDNPIHGLRFTRLKDRGHIDLETPVVQIRFSKHPDLRSPVLWTSDQVNTSGFPILSLYQAGDGFALAVDCAGRGVFFYPNDSDEIHVSWEEGGTSWEHYFLSVGLGAYFELQGAPCLHGNVLSRGEGAFGLLAASASGKSTLSLELVTHGCRLLSDDLLVIHPDQSFLAFASQPAMRLWPDSLNALGMKGAVGRLRRVHADYEKRVLSAADCPDFFDSTPRPLRALYLLERASGHFEPITIKTLRPAEAVIALLRQSTLGDAPKAMGRETDRLECLGQLVGRVPIRVVSYPTGFERLGEVCNAVTEDFERLPAV